MHNIYTKFSLVRHILPKAKVKDRINTSISLAPKINVTDVNDNAPYLDDPREVQVIENSKPQVVARVKLGDPDNWRQGHGPPFSIHLDPRAPPHIKAAVKVKHDKSESSLDIFLACSRFLFVLAGNRKG